MRGEDLADEKLQGGELCQPEGGVDFEHQGIAVLVEDEGGPAVVFSVDEAVAVGSGGVELAAAAR